MCVFVMSSAQSGPSLLCIKKLCALGYLDTPSEDSDHTAQMHRLI